MKITGLGPYTIVEISKTSCRLKNVSGKLLKTQINVNQLRPYHCYPQHQVQVIIVTNVIIHVVHLI